MQKSIIGVIGGMGPHAGVDVVRKIIDETIASRDQEHLPVALLSFSDRIPDRSAYLLDKGENPAPAIIETVRALIRSGATALGIPCNTAHAEPIFRAVRDELAADNNSPRLLHIIEETIRFLHEEHPQFERIGVVSTYATFRMGLYEYPIEKAGLTAVLPDEDIQANLVHRSIFLPPHGIKAQSDPISPIAREALIFVIDHLRQKNADCVILACTELPLAVRERSIDGMPIIDPNRILARALIRETYPEKLRLHGRR